MTNNSKIMAAVSAMFTAFLLLFCFALCPGCEPSGKYETEPVVRIDSDRTEWLLIQGGDTIHSRGYSFYYEPLPESVDTLTLITLGRGYATLQVWPLGLSVTAYEQDTVRLAP